MNPAAVLTANGAACCGMSESTQVAIAIHIEQRNQQRDSTLKRVLDELDGKPTLMPVIAPTRRWRIALLAPSGERVALGECTAATERAAIEVVVEFKRGKASIANHAPIVESIAAHAKP